jgi:hypothetical protein
MKTRKTHLEEASTLICAICTILIISLIGANVLLNCTTRYNVSSNQVRAWKEALYAAESAGDIAYAELRKTVSNPSGAFTGWTSSGTPANPSYTSPVSTFGQDNLKASSVVDLFYTDAYANKWYRIRAKGIAPVQGLRRVGMDDRMIGTTRGDSLLRKIDFKYDHFTATYGNGDGTGQSLVAVGSPQIARRIELIASAVTPFGAAVKVTTSFDGPGSAGLFDSFNSNNGAYYFAANNPSDVHYADSHSASVAVGTANFLMHNGPIWGDVSTNGGNVTPSPKIHGTIDNNVPFTVPPLVMPSLPPFQASPNNFNGNQTVTPSSPGFPSAPTAYLVGAWSGNVTIAQSGSAETYVAVHVTGDITGSITVKPAVHLQVFFDGNMALKARDIDNQTGLAGNLQFYGISPTAVGATQSIDIAPPGDFTATFYAPSADFTVRGNPDMIGAIVAKSYSGNGNTSLHYDRALDRTGDAIDYKISSYLEDTR